MAIGLVLRKATVSLVSLWLFLNVRHLTYILSDLRFSISFILRSSARERSETPGLHQEKVDSVRESLSVATGQNDLMGVFSNLPIKRLF